MLEARSPRDHQRSIVFTEMPKMLVNETLLQVATDFVRQPVDWLMAVAAFKQSAIFAAHKYDTSKLASYLSEIHLKQCLENASRVLGYAAGQPVVNCRPVQLGRRFGSDKRFSFRENYLGNLVVVDHLSEGREYMEIDALITAGRLPSLFEIKLSSRKAATYRSLEEMALNPNRLRKRLMPLHTYFGRGVSYVYVFPRGEFQESLPQVKAFIRAGGMCVEMAETLPEFRLKVNNLLREDPSLRTPQINNDPNRRYWK